MRALAYILLLIPFGIISQVNIDSLRKVWNDPNQSDTNRLNAVYVLSWNGYLFTNNDSAFYYAQLQYDFADEKGIKKMKASALNTMAVVYYVKGDFDKCIDFFTKCLKIDQEIGDKHDESAILNNLGIICQNQGNYDQALDYHTQSLSIRTEIGDRNGEANSLNNIGYVYEHKEDHELALNYYAQSLEIATELGDKKVIATIFDNKALTYQNQEDYDQAIEYQNKCLALYKELDMKSGVASSLVNLGVLYKTKGDNVKSLFFAEEGLNVAKQIESIEDIKNGAELLWQLYKQSGTYNKALEMFELHIEMRDSIEREENQKAVIQQQYKYEYEKKAAADSIKAMEEAKVQSALLSAEKAESEKHRTQVKQQEQEKYYLFGGLALALLFGGFVFNRFRVASKQKDIIEEQKALVEQQKSEVETQKVELEATHEQLEEHHKEIADSIMYAKRIQEAIMPSMSSMDAALKDGFVLYLPKDVVAGDFFWMEQVDMVTYYAAADCTGHGVPGAMVSVVCSNALNKALLEEGIWDTGKLLDRTREIVIDRLAKSGEEVKDGMDISLCALNNNTRELKWAGANNPLWILRKGAEDFEEIKANKQPIGKYADPKPFTEHKLQLEEGDSIYVFTDGYQDQFGGPKGKKFKAKQLKELLLQSQSLSMNDQMNLLQSKFMEWKGEVEQIDDVCIIGVRV